MEAHSHVRPQAPLVALAAFIRQRLTDVSGSLTPRWPRRTESSGLAARSGEQHATLAGARQVAMVIIGAAAPFAPTPHARLRLLRQLHASGLLTERETQQATDLLGAPR